jgi:signal transduction histidine kinase
MTTDDCDTRTWHDESRPWWNQAGSGWLALFAFFSLGSVWAAWNDESNPLPRWLLVVIWAASFGALVLVRTRPVLSGALLAVLTAISAVAGPASASVVFVAARWYRLATALWVAGFVVVGTGLRALWWPADVGIAVRWWLLGDVAVHAALLGWGALWRTRAQLVASLRERARRAEREQEHRVEEARTAERTRIAREMHDTLAHRLTLVATTAGALEYRSADLSREQVATAAGVVRSNASEALEELRTVIGVLRTSPEELRPTPGLADLPRLVDETRRAGVDVTLDAADLDLPTALDLAVYRTCQEGLTNARRHAPGSRVTVNVMVEEGLRVVVANDRGGKGEGNGTGTGLIGLTERVELLGGRIQAGPTPHGFRLEAWLPWEA